MTNKNLIKGYMIEMGEMEQLFAVYPNGTITTCTKKFSTTFNEKGVEWETVSELPKEAEFIGNYEM